MSIKKNIILKNYSSYLDNENENENYMHMCFSQKKKNQIFTNSNRNK